MKNSTPFVPKREYFNADIQKFDVFFDNKNQ